MFWLIRMTFLLAVILALLPTGGGAKHDTAGTPGARIGATDAVSAATATVSDMWQFCARQPHACEIGSHAAVAFGTRAEAGARMVYDFISERAAPRDTGSIDARPANAAKASRDTLTASDVAPAWRSPRHDTRNDVHKKHGA
ncbi:MAG TPA: DUF5330 domain-containing protein [Xanthobacteraceae bacterium]|nr:DUF5330 domain-containing protein [Xanthobacteraceae bacterium]